METNKYKWVLDPTHSELLFRVKHLMITNVKGEFRSFKAEANGDDLFTTPVKVTIDTASVFTNNDDRDNHLRSADFLDVEKYPEIVFESTTFEPSGDDYKLRGQLTIKGITNPVELNVEFGGTNTDPWGNEKAGFSVEGKIERKAWGLTWNAALETGGVMVSDEVKIQAEVQFVKQPAAQSEDNKMQA